MVYMIFITETIAKACRVTKSIANYHLIIIIRPTNNQANYPRKNNSSIEEKASLLFFLSCCFAKKNRKDFALTRKKEILAVKNATNLFCPWVLFRTTKQK